MKNYIELIVRILTLIGLIAILVFALKGMLGVFQMSEKYTEAQKKADDKWRKENKEHAKLAK